VARVALLDVNILVALFDADHVHHDLAHDWLAEEGRRAWATCAVTENGFIRVVSNPHYHPNSTIRPAVAADALRQFCRSGGHQFWKNTVSLCDRKLFDLSVAGSYRQLTDIYLLGLARAMGGRLATFDRTIPHRAVVGATRDTLALIEPGRS
jgi:toxin-antitoxin system PIN domain toxin